MSYKDILPTTNLNAVDIRDTLGVASNNLAHYCTKAKSGGIDGYAFNIVENGSTPSNGDLIDGAEPYFNIFSENAPGEWVIGVGTDLKYRLKRNSFGTVTVGGYSFDSDSYCFNIGAFAGYKHSAVPPIFNDQSEIVEQSSGLYAVRVGYFSPGDFDWGEIAENEGNDRDLLYYGISSTSSAIVNSDTTMAQIDDAGALIQSYSTVGIPPSTLSISFGLFKKAGTDNYKLLFKIPFKTGDGTGASLKTVSISPTVTQLPQAPSVTGVRVYSNEDKTSIYYGWTMSCETVNSSSTTLTFTIIYASTDLKTRITNLEGSYTYENEVYSVDSMTMTYASSNDIGDLVVEESAEVFKIQGLVTNVSWEGSIIFDVWPS